MTAAAYLAVPARPPHDPTWLRLGSNAGWPAAAKAGGVEINPATCALVLAPLPGIARSLAERSGSLGGLVAPRNVAVDDEGAIWLLDSASGQLKRFDQCCCEFVSVPCTAGKGGGARELVRPAGMAIDGTWLLLCDAGPPGRLLVFDRRSFALRAVWQPPAGAVGNPWQPEAVVIDGAHVLVADPANGAIHRFARWGGWQGAWLGMGAAIALAVDCSHRLFVVQDGASTVRVLDLAGKQVLEASRPVDVACAFPNPPFEVARDGSFDLAGLCDGAGWYDLSGQPIPASPPPAATFPLSGTWTSAAIDSRIARCTWHRIVARKHTPNHTRVRFFTFTAEVDLPDTHVLALGDEIWRAVPAMPDCEDALILSPPGRFIWLKVVLEGDGTDTPLLCDLDIEYPRISLRRYLPSAFGSDIVGADFADRLLAIFDRGFRDLELRIDQQAELFDADSAPAENGRDVLGWLGSWLGLALERNWPVARRRAVLKSAARLFACRGTRHGLWASLLLWLGWHRFDQPGRRPGCGPRCRGPWPSPQPPALILEHWKLRRWLFLGHGRLGNAAELWGEKILRRSQLDGTAQLGATRLDTTRNPLLDPFNRDAHRFSVFLPAHMGRSGSDRATLDRVVGEHRPAHTSAQIIYVAPRMRIGIQASLGLDSVVGCWPSGVTLDSAQLGRGTILSGGNPGGSASRIGRTARLLRGPVALPVPT